MNALKTEPPLEVVLHPGEYFFGDRDSRIRTVLGTCVSVTCWHPRLHIGGMCHYMLPARTPRKAWELDGRYADEAIEWLLREMKHRSTHPREYQVKMFGGGNMFPGSYRENTPHVGAKNVDAGRRLLELHGFTASVEELGGAGHRSIIFEIWNGHVWVKRVPVSHVPKGEMP
jgi:chemotaxis protein CheD